MEIKYEENIGGLKSWLFPRTVELIALQEQLGLRLRSQKAPVEILLVDHAERPSEN